MSTTCWLRPGWCRRIVPDPPKPAVAAQAKGALLFDIRGDDRRRTGGLIPGALALSRNSLEWRCDPRRSGSGSALALADLQFARPGGGDRSRVRWAAMALDGLHQGHGGQDHCQAGQHVLVAGPSDHQGE
jgi:hypothetical protein